MKLALSVLVCALCPLALAWQSTGFVAKWLSRTRARPATVPELTGSAWINGHHSALKQTRLDSSLDATVLDAPPMEKQATPAQVALQKYVEEHGGKRVIKRILIANNGMAATKAILSMRQWAYVNFGDERTVEFIAMATPEDLAANAEFVRLADKFVEVPGGSNKNNYAKVDLIVQIAEQERVDAVWPGWGHASENPRLPNTLAERGIQFIGPTGPVMSVLGDKIAANILAQTAKVPSIPWSGDGLVAELTEEGTIPDEIFQKAMVHSVEEALASADRIGYPVMLKASEGGGGKGIRLSKDAEELRTNFYQVANEVPGSPMFMMQLCTNARHLEVQIVGDEYGNAVALNGRDCSTQRRFQKIFEEGPPVVAPAEVFKQMERSAQRLTQSIGYKGAGTVEYLYNAASNKYYFLELNPRLQVEHPVTEGLTGINLPATQLQVAMGISLTRIPDVRRFYSRDPDGDDTIDFMNEDYRPITNHVIAARITAENPDEGFKPTSGRIERVKFQSANNVWGYFSVGANGGIHEYADSQFGHLFASGSSREEARKALVLALKELQVRGDIRTTVEYLVQLLETDAFKQNTIDTSWLDGLIKAKAVNLAVDPHMVALSVAIYRAQRHCGTEEQKIIENFSKGQVSLQGLETAMTFPVEVTYENVKYKFTVTRVSPDTFKLLINDQGIEVRVREQPDKSLLCTIGGETRKLYGQEEALGCRISIDGVTIFVPTIYNPSELRTDVTGKVIRYLQEDGANIEKGQPYVEVEAMKMVMPLRAPESGSITHHLSPGSIIQTGDMLASLSLKDPSKVRKIIDFDSRLVGVVDSELAAEKTTEDAVERLSQCLDGYHDDPEQVVRAITSRVTDARKLSDIAADLLEKYLTVEEQFAGKNTDEAMSCIVKANKENMRTALNLAFSHKQLKRKNALLQALLREIELFSENLLEYTVPPRLQAGLDRVGKLPGKVYGELALRAAMLLYRSTTEPFEKRVAALKAMLLTSQDRQELAESPDLAAGVDLLSALFKDPDAKVRAAALEVYVRRVYRAHSVLKIDVSEANGILSASWVFTLKEFNTEETARRSGFMVMLDSFDELSTKMHSTVLEMASASLVKHGYAEPVNMLHIGFADAPLLSTEEDHQAAVRVAESTIISVSSALRALDVRQVNLLLTQQQRSRVRYFSFYESAGYAEDPLSRNMRPTLPHLLELKRLSVNYNLERLPTFSRNSQLYLGVDGPIPGKGKRVSPQVLFLRAISHSSTISTLEGAERVMVMAMDEIERASLDPRVGETSSSRVFLNVLPEIALSKDECVVYFDQIMDNLVSKYASRLLKLNIDEIEVKMRIRTPTEKGGEIVPVRLIATSINGGWLKRGSFREYRNAITGETERFCNLTGDETVCILNPYPSANSVQLKRAAARRIGSTYAYDFLGLLEVSLVQEWARYNEETKGVTQMPLQLFKSEELLLQGGKLVTFDRTVGMNKIGMVGWHLTMKTPEYPEGREIVLLANDVTVQSGSFGVQEDEFFLKVSEYARVRGLPRVYIACNSGARIGLVDELKPAFRVAWKNELNPSLGFDYLYLTEEDYDKLPAGTVNAHAVDVQGEKRYALDDIIGTTHGIGVENLRGSGMIAGETSRAYDETFTLSYVTGRSVGIGAYLVRLGQRNIQMETGPIILTGYSALNKLLGREVYTSQDQLGGPQIMYPNGVSHEIVPNDREGVASILRWLSFVPKTKASIHTAPALPSVDPVDRPVSFVPPTTPYDPRHMLAGASNPDGSWQPGFFDQGTFKEYMAGWGKSVVTGRARLGGIPVGVIAVETRMVEQRVPADPANPESREAIQPQAGQVWYPDSAYKTAQAIADFNRGENLPLMIFANWRGFSGGTRDMYGEILKFGAMIVDNLRTYKHPVHVYIPPHAELRGGAWVVIDPTINEDMMEMYADPDSRGGILEPPGICEVKFRGVDQLAAMHRLDATLKAYDAELENSPNAQDATRIKGMIKEREEQLKPLYLQVAHTFADLHDRAGRMKAKGVIRDIVAWEHSRTYFFWRIRRRLLEQDLCTKLQEASFSLMALSAAKTRVAELLPPGTYENDKATVQWLTHNQQSIDELIADTQRTFAREKVHGLLASLSESDKRLLLESLQ